MHSHHAVFSHQADRKQTRNIIYELLASYKIDPEQGSLCRRACERGARAGAQPAAERDGRLHA